MTYKAYFNHYNGEDIIGQNTKEYEADTKSEAELMANRTVQNTNMQFAHTGKTVALCMLLNA